MIHYGVILVVVGFAIIVHSRSAKTRASWWGVLYGLLFGFSAAWVFLIATWKRQF
jgi:uncharacterized membrane protein HdeD (DUF308 family)